jgi:large subunit ribosomal protein L9
MKIIFLKDLIGTARKGETKEVSGGFALNRLLPQKIAVAATPENLARLSKDKAEGEKRHRLKITQAQEASAKLSGQILKLPSKASPAGKLFAAIGAKEIAQALKQQFGVEVKETAIIGAPLKTLGAHKIILQFTEEKNCEIKVVIEKK